MARVGMALTFAIVIGLSACLGTLIPLLALHQDVLFSAKRLTVLVGMMIMLAGIYFCAKAGREREQIQASEVSAASQKKGEQFPFRDGRHDYDCRWRSHPHAELCPRLW